MTTADKTTAVAREASAELMLFWEREVARLMREAASAALNDEATDALCDLSAEFEARIAEAPCDSRLAATVKLRTVVRTASVEGGTYRGLDAATMINGIVAFMEGQGPTAGLET